MALKTCTRPAGSVGAYGHIQIRLSQDTVVTSGGANYLASPIDVTAAADGSYTTQLQANADLTPTGTFYTVTEFAGTTDFTYYIQVPTSAGPFVITTIQVAPLPTVAATPNHISTLTVDGQATFGTKKLIAPLPNGTDDTSVLNALLSAGGVEIQLQLGTYNITSSLVIANNTRLVGSGPGTILFANVTGANTLNLFTGGPSNFELAHFTIDGNRANRTAAGIETTQCNIYLSNATRGMIHDLVVHDAASNGICLTGSTYITIGRNICYANQRNGIALSWSNNAYCTISGNVCYSQQIYSGIAIDDSPSNAVTGNTCYNNGVPGANAGAGIWVDGVSDYTTVSGNVCIGNRGAGVRIGDTSAAIRGPAYSTITGNTIALNYRAGIDSVRGNNNIYTGNAIYNNSQESNNFYPGISLATSGGFSTANCLVQGNFVNTNHSVGVNVADGSSLNNRILDNDLSGNSGGGIGLNATSYIARNKGKNPVGSVSTPGFPATTVAVSNTTSYDVQAYITNGTSALTVQVDAVTALMVIPATQTGTVMIPAGSTFTPTYGGGAPTWKWYGL